MALNVQVGTITQPGGTGNQTYDLPANFDPKALILWTAPVNERGSNTAANAGLCLGFATYRGGAVQQRSLRTSR